MRTVTHHQLSMETRDSRDGDYLNDLSYSTRKRASYLHRERSGVKAGSHNTGFRSWSNSTKDRHNGGYHFIGPGWMLPKVIATVTASVVWGVCGKMADMPEY